MMRNSYILTLAVTMALAGCSTYHASSDNGTPDNTSTAMNTPQDMGYGAPQDNQAINSQGNLQSVTPKQAGQQPAAMQNNTPTMNSSGNTASYQASSGLNNASASPSDNSTSPPNNNSGQMAGATAMNGQGQSGAMNNQLAQNSSNAPMAQPGNTGTITETPNGTPNVVQTPKQATDSANLGPNPAGVNPANTLSAADQQFLTDAFGSGQYEIAASQKALAKSQDAGVKKIAQQMIDDHSKADDQLTDLATSKGDHNLGGMNATETDNLAQLDKFNGGDFDSQYLHQQQSAHQQAVSEFKQESTTADDPQIRQWAAATLPTLQAHLNMINEQISPNIGSER